MAVVYVALLAALALMVSGVDIRQEADCINFHGGVCIPSVVCPLGNRIQGVKETSCPNDSVCCNPYAEETCSSHGGICRNVDDCGIRVRQMSYDCSSQGQICCVLTR